MTELAPIVVDFAADSFAVEARSLLAQTSSIAPVAVVVPAWFAMTDRHQLITYLDHGGERPVGLVSSALAGAYGRYIGRTGRRASAPVLVLDVRLGWSAGLIHFEPTHLTEVAAWGIAPHEVVGRLDDAVVCPWLVEHLFEAASAIAGTRSIEAVVVIDDAGGRAAMVSDAVERCAHPLARCQVHVEKSTEVVAGAASFFGSPDDSPGSAGALAHALTVRADGDPQRLAMHVVAAQHAPFPSTTRRLFELGPNDGAPLHFDIFEQHRDAPAGSAIDHRLVVRARMVRERGYDQQMMVTFELGSNGLLSVAPVKAWRLDWQVGSLSLESVV